MYIWDREPNNLSSKRYQNNDNNHNDNQAL